MTHTAHPSMTILYVADVAASARFYRTILGLEPVEESPGFAMFVLPGGGRLGLWLSPAVEPAVTAGAGGSEVCCALPDAATLHATHSAWTANGIAILQAPTEMDFGLTFTAADPDGHRLRVFVPA